MSGLLIPVFNPHPEVDALWDELQAAIQGVLRSGQFINGPNVQAFEKEVAEYLGVRYAIGLNSGTDALIIALRAAGVQPGDEVITTPFTFFATAEAISQVGAIPVFVDVDPQTYNIDPNQIRSAITGRTRAIVPVHLYGLSADMESIEAIAEEHGLRVIEDVAQAFGAEHKGRKVGTIGAAGAFSFFPTKNLGAYGDGGLIATNDEKVAEMSRMLRVHGSKKKYYNEVVGYNSRLDEIQAAILRVKLRYVDRWNEGRRRVAHLYNHLLKDVPAIVTPREHEGNTHVFHQYTIRLLDRDRDDVQKRMAEAGIGTMVYYPVPSHKLPVYHSLGYSLPVAEELAGQVLSLPMWPQIELHVQGQVVEQLMNVLTAAK